MKTFVTDFDGTLTAYDFFDLVRERWPSPPGEDPWDQYVAGEITHFEALARIFRRIRTTEAVLLDLAGSMQLDPEVSAAERSLRDRGWSVVVASAGCDWYIRRLLGETGTTMEIHANPGEFREEEGLIMSLPQGSRFFSPETGVDKLAIVREAIRRSSEVAFAGDGRPDLEPALLMPAERRFARGWLAGELDRRQEGYRAFSRWSEIAPQLIAG
jgi:2,3-diketo-5-methylthio-1-phosphopentane phosphatase